VEFIKDKKIVGVMGGRALKRASEAYKHTVRLSKKLTEHGFTMLSGGGGGAMEATCVS
jgi:predicted Rossmann-fold nucleotide-binding protein